MTVAAQIPTISYAENGSTISFPVPFRYDTPSDLKAFRRAASGAVTQLVYGTDYTATPGPTNAGGTLTTTVAAASGTTLVIERSTARGQTADYETTGAFTAQSHELALDKAMLVAQEQDVNLARAVKVQRGEAELTMDPQAQLEGKVLVVAGNRLTGGARVAEPLPIKQKPGTSLVLEADEAFTVIETTSNSPVTFTIQNDSVVNHPVGTYFELHWGGNGQVTMATAPGVTLDSYGDARVLAGRNAVVGVRKMGSNRWRAVGHFA